ncbi:hypothetical protein H632_c670p0 [Helicosporidium sp. ATCC 50920]|nr:hypothetical protein H632_c670p0 [Helicosporidium sp. ATCC 50920]|eukprot:KDD75468.1 hypothetical protein H632_c670p0 [Helicosporidium sp. ATCC 50920]
MAGLARLFRPLTGALRAQALPGAVAGVKTTTGIVGVPLDEQAREHLTAKYDQVLDAIKTIPESAEYRAQVEKTVKYKQGILQTHDADEAAEAAFGRQLEEEIQLCDRELELIPKMAEWKPWEVRTRSEDELLAEREVKGETSASS